MEWRFSLFLLSLFGLLVGLAWATSEAGMCSSAYLKSVLSDQTKDGALNCFDFWLNRYQTLIGAIVAVAAAGAAWISVRKQIDVAQQQIKVMTGELDPDFYIRQVIYGRQDLIANTVMTVINLNRRELMIRRVEVIAPVDARAMLGRREDARNMHRLTGAHQNRVFDIYSRVPGTHPTADEPSKAEFDLSLVMPNSERPLGEVKASVKLSVRIYYVIIGRRAEPRTADVECELHAR